ncbi:ElaA protein [Microbacterium endophyticum]|uniref:ElaA protein n=1 Tax=Microbacterium endophyticum TaxID=1526412 RepID=A0A7W4V2Z0_9MICO|nr:GNAT family N-acetyltransferase [Microbacterium endophyticum]MBB2975902.1 ElaA protein [Microbacterium endophyticum]NIK36385.1 ElaA protein [Microbacterium endophyticum]
MTRHFSAVADISPSTLYAIARLRLMVFVVEQDAAYPDLDGRDIEPGAELAWAVDDETAAVTATLRVLDDGDAMRIGRVATDAAYRGRGIAGDLMAWAVARCEERRPGVPIDLDAQEHLSAWYGRFGFVVSGPAFAEDGIPHVPMRRS